MRRTEFLKSMFALLGVAAVPVSLLGSDVQQTSLHINGVATSPCKIIAETKFGRRVLDWDGVSDFVMDIEPDNEVYQIIVQTITTSDPLGKFSIAVAE